MKPYCDTRQNNKKTQKEKKKTKIKSTTTMLSALKRLRMNCTSLFVFDKRLMRDEVRLAKVEYVTALLLSVESKPVR